MLAYRISKSEYINDLSGTGARIYGGRWNRKGVPVIYASDSISLAALEFLVHVSHSLVPLDLSIATLEVSETNVEFISKKNLPKNWREYPEPTELVDIGTKWALSKRYLLMRVPSVIIEGEYNLLINPLHPDISLVKIKNIKSFSFDKRLLR